VNAGEIIDISEVDEIILEVTSKWGLVDAMVTKCFEGENECPY